jgi:cystathionine beta-lyase/cystathionine gamma-synthase
MISISHNEAGMQHAVSTEAAKAVPAVVGAAAAWVTPSGYAAAVTIFYVVLQAAYLIWKWRREAKQGK